MTSDTRIEIVVFRIEIVVFRDLKLKVGIGMCVCLLKLLFNYNEMEKLHGNYGLIHFQPIRYQMMQLSMILLYLPKIVE